MGSVNREICARPERLPGFFMGEVMPLNPSPSRLNPAQQSRAAFAPKKADPFYLSPEWRKLRDTLITERGRRCENCGKTHEDDGSPVRLVADHSHERRDGGANLDKRNIKLLCARTGGNGAAGLGGCNNRKTARAKRERRGALPTSVTGLDGWPVS
jgi:5-methylcytosine-specific restriction protein A